MRYNRRQQCELIAQADAVGIKVSVHDGWAGGPMLIHPDGKHEVTWSDLAEAILVARALRSNAQEGRPNVAPHVR